ncbi:hypothetical protein GGR57DRAFT_506770 [Xylariaceae sp. FL1272]|nr:hypothetical protein GGR57DRAFT_506770 [Xylariaceae sp. FL1272]
MCVDVDCVWYENCGHEVNFYNKESRFCLLQTFRHGKKANETDFHVVNSRESTIKNVCPRCMIVYNLRVEFRENGTKLPRQQFQEKVDEMYLATGDGQSAMSGRELIAAADKALADLTKEQIADLQIVAENNVIRILTSVKTDPEDKAKSVQRATPGAKCDLLKAILCLPSVFRQRDLVYTFGLKYGLAREAWEIKRMYDLARKTGHRADLRAYFEDGYEKKLVGL